MGQGILFLALCLIGGAWGLSIPLAKVAVSTGHHPIGLIVWEFAIAVGVVGTVSLFRKRGFSLSPARLAFFLVVAVFGTLVPQFVTYRVAAELPAGILAIVIAIIPMFALPMAIALRLDSPEFRRVLGVITGAVAIILLVGPETSLPDPAKVGFVFLALLIPFCYAIEANYVTMRDSEHLDAAHVLLGSAIVGLVLTFPVSLVTQTWISPLNPWGEAEWALVALALLHATAYWGYFWLISAAGGVFASQIGYLVTGTGVLWSIILLGESYSGWIWAALALMMIGIGLVRPREAPPDA